MGLFSKLLKPITSIFGEVLGFLTGTDFDDDQEASGVLFNKQSNIEPIPVIYGRRKVGGVRAFISTGGGKKNEFLYIAIALSEGEIDAIEEIYINDTLHTDSKYSGLVEVDTTKLGSDDQVYSDLLSGADSAWGLSHRLRGVAYLAIKLKYDQDVFGGIPSIQCVVRGRKVYDPRTGQTAWSSNPALCLRDYLTNSRYGKGLSTSLIDDASFIAAANFLDETETQHTTPVSTDGAYPAGAVSLNLSGQFSFLGANSFLQFAGQEDLFQVGGDVYGAGSSVFLLDPLSFSVISGTSVTFKQKIYECNAVIDTGKKLFDNVKILLQGMRGLMPYSNGIYSLIIDKDEPATFALNPSNITSSIQVSSSGKDKKYNKVTVKYINPQANWQDDAAIYPDAGSPEETQFLAEDNGEELAREVTMSTITSPYSAKDLAKIICLASRQNTLTTTITATSEALAISVGDVVTLEHPSLGWDNGSEKNFRVISMQLMDDGEVRLTLQEYTASIYPWVTGDEADSSAETSLPDPFTIGSPSALNLLSAFRTTDDNNIIPRIVVSFTAADDAFVESYVIKISPSGFDSYQAQINVSNLTAEQIARTSAVTYLIEPAIATSYTITVRARNSLGVTSAAQTGTVNVSGDTTEPSAPAWASTPLYAGIKSIGLNWINPSDLDFAYVQAERKTTGDSDSNYIVVAKVYGAAGQSSSHVDTGLADNISYTYRLFAYDWSNNKSATAGARSLATLDTLVNEVGIEPLNAHGYVYWQTPQASAPSGSNLPTATGYDFDADPNTNPITGLTSGWDINPPTPSTNTATSGLPYWVARYHAYEESIGGSTSVDFSSPFQSTVFDGLVTFRNLNPELADPASSLVTKIDGGLIKTGTVELSGDNVAGMAVRLGKTSYSDDSNAGFWIGNTGTSASVNPNFNIGSSNNYLKFDGTDVVATGIKIEANDGTLLLDAGDSRYRNTQNNNLVYNGDFSIDADPVNETVAGWDLSQAGTDVNVVASTGGYGTYIRIKEQQSDFPITESTAYASGSGYKFAVTKGEVLYVYSECIGVEAYLQVLFYNADGSYTGLSTILNDNDVKPDMTDSNMALRVGQITVPTTDGYNIAFAALRFGCQTNSDTSVVAQADFKSVGVSRIPPVIDPSYASTYIRDLSVDTLQIQNNAVTVPDGRDGTDNTDCGSGAGDTFVECQDGGSSARVTISWSSDEERPKAIICGGFVSFFGEDQFGNTATADTLSVRMSAEDGSGTEYIVANSVGQSFGFGQGGGITTVGHFALTTQTSPLQIWIEAKSNLAAGERKMGAFGFYVLGAKK